MKNVYRGLVRQRQIRKHRYNVSITIVSCWSILPRV